MTKPNGPRRPYTPAAAAQPEPTVPPAPARVAVMQEDPLMEIVGGGYNAREALTAILGEDHLTGDTATDCKAAMQAIYEYDRALTARRALILHALYSQAPEDNGKDRWAWVGYQVGRAKSTVWDWAHPGNGGELS